MFIQKFLFSLLGTGGDIEAETAVIRHSEKLSEDSYLNKSHNHSQSQNGSINHDDEDVDNQSDHGSGDEAHSNGNSERRRVGDPPIPVVPISKKRIRGDDLDPDYEDSKLIF